MKRRAFLEKKLKKAGLTDAEIQETLSDLEGDIADDRAAAAEAALLTVDEAAASDAVAKVVKGKTKKEVLDGVDAILKTYEGKLTPAQKAEYTKLGADSFKKSQFLLKTFDEKGTPTGDAAYDALKDELDELKENTVSKTDYQTVTTQLTAAQKSSIDKELVLSARLNPKLRDVNGERHFRGNFVADAENYLTQTGIAISDKTRVKGVIDPVTGELRKADKPDEAISLGGRPATINDLAEQVISNESLGWGKKADSTSSGGITVPADSKNASMSRAAAANLADD